jgi:hypothetical protein
MNEILIVVCGTEILVFVVPEPDLLSDPSSIHYQEDEYWRIEEALNGRR